MPMYSRYAQRRSFEDETPPPPVFERPEPPHRPEGPHDRDRRGRPEAPPTTEAALVKKGPPPKRRGGLNLGNLNLNALLSGFKGLRDFENDDLLLILILIFLYNDKADEELLILLGLILLLGLDG